MRLGFDVDGVLANFTIGFRELLEQVIRKPLPDDEPTVWEWPATLGVTREQEEEAWARIHRSPDFWSALPNSPGFTTALCSNLAEIARDHDVYFITDRPTRSGKHQTEQWLIDRGLPPSVLITPHKGLACRVLNLDIYIDDKPSNCVDAAGLSTARVYLYRRPWNTSFTPQISCTPVTTLNELFEKEGL